MTTFGYRDGHYHAEDVALRRIADDIGTPFYCYSRSAIASNFRAYADALKEFDAQVCYAVKANSNQAIIFRKVHQSHTLGIAPDFPNVPHAGPKNHAFGRHKHDFIGIPYLMKGNGRPIFLRHFDANHSFTRSRLCAIFLDLRTLAIATLCHR